MLLSISMIASFGAGTLALIASRRQPDKAQELHGLGFFFYGVAVLIGFVFFR